MKKLLLSLCCIAAMQSTVSAKITPKDAKEFVETGKKTGIFLTAVPQGQDSMYVVSFQFSHYKVDVRRKEREAMKNSALYKGLDSIAKGTQGIDIGIAGGYAVYTTKHPMDISNVISITYTPTGVSFTTVELPSSVGIGVTDRETILAYTTYVFSDVQATVSIKMSDYVKTISLDQIIAGNY